MKLLKNYLLNPHTNSNLVRNTLFWRATVTIDTNTMSILVAGTRYQDILLGKLHRIDMMDNTEFEYLHIGTDEEDDF